MDINTYRHHVLGSSGKIADFKPLNSNVIDIGQFDQPFIPADRKSAAINNGGLCPIVGEHNGTLRSGARAGNLYFRLYTPPRT